MATQPFDEVARVVAAVRSDRAWIDTALLQLAALEQFPNKRGQQLSKAVSLTPVLQIIVHRRLRRKTPWQEPPLHARVQHEKHRFEHLTRIGRRPPKPSMVVRAIALVKWIGDVRSGALKASSAPQSS
jgi:hypothetical protein